MNSKKIIKFNLIFSAIVVVTFFITNNSVRSQNLIISENLIYLDSMEGEKLLTESKAKADYIPLIINFALQDNLAYCGPASITMALNALKIPAPEAYEYKYLDRSYPIFTQDNIFNENTDKVITAKQVARGGMTLEQLGDFLAQYPIKVEIYYGSDVTLDDFRRLLKENLQQKDNYILINYLRKTINQEAGGHISPIASYHEESDRFLILDVARYKYPPVWVKTEELWNAINTVDSTSGKTRGFVLLSK